MSRLFTKPRKKPKTPANSKQPVIPPQAAENPFAQDHPDALYILRLSHEGRGVARTAEGKTVFVEGALPGEWVTARVRFTRSRYDEAVVDQILQPSAERETPPCPHYAQCGGCNLQHLQTGGQLDFKQQLVAELLQQPLEILETPLTSSLYAYRRKARLGIKWRKDGRLLLGFREKNSAFITATPDCLVLTPELQALLPALNEHLPRLEGKKHLGHIELIQGENQLGLVVRLLRPFARLSPIDRRLWQSWAEQQQLLLLLQDASGLHALDEPADQALFSYQLAGQTLHFAASDFIQVNAQMNRQMVVQALAWLDLQGREKVLDLFCGFGNFSLPLAEQAAEVLGVEVLPGQVERGRFNAQYNQLQNCSFQVADLNLPLEKQTFASQAWDVVLLDPPRAGAEQLARQMRQLDAAKLLYISCNPATLARDAELLKTQGYQLQRLGILDMFPQTAHVETMALFVRNPG